MLGTVAKREGTWPEHDELSRGRGELASGLVGSRSSKAEDHGSKLLELIKLRKIRKMLKLIKISKMIEMRFSRRKRVVAGSRGALRPRGLQVLEELRHVVHGAGDAVQRRRGYGRGPGQHLAAGGGSRHR